jgi:hypothetical protein
VDGVSEPVFDTSSPGSALVGNHTIGGKGNFEVDHTSAATLEVGRTAYR